MERLKLIEGQSLLKKMGKDDYAGYYSLEWEKRWHREIAEPEIAFADYQEAIRKYF